MAEYEVGGCGAAAAPAGALRRVTPGAGTAAADGAAAAAVGAGGAAEAEAASCWARCRLVRGTTSTGPDGAEAEAEAVEAGGSSPQELVGFERGGGGASSGGGAGSAPGPRWPPPGDIPPGESSRLCSAGNLETGGEDFCHGSSGEPP